MPNPNAIVDGISKISPSTEDLAARPLKPSLKTITVNFQGGRSAFLDMSIPRSVVWADILDSWRKADRPVYVEINPETNVITQLLLPLVVTVESITPIITGDIEVRLINSHALHYLRRKNPDFQDILNALQIALEEESEVVVTDTLDGYQIIDVKPLPKPRMAAAPQARPTPPPPPTQVTPQKAQQLFDLVKSINCDPNTTPSPCIPFMYPDNGCWARAHEMCRIIIGEGEQPEKIWIYGDLHVQTSNHPNCQIPGWGWHIAPTLLVSTSTGTESYVIDPSLFNGPIRQDQWKRVQGDPNAILEPSNASFYKRGQGESYEEYDDSAYTKTRNDLDFYRGRLKNRSSISGPPPYNSCIPDIYLRDNLQDSGVEPLVGGGISASPDINHYRQEVSDPQGVLGTPAAEVQDTLFEMIESGQENYIYLRLQNRGYAAAQVDVDVYYTLPSTLPTPGNWKLIDSFTTPPIVPGEFKVVGPVVWNQIPKKGHYCFIAVLGNAQDPKPDLGAIHTIDEFYSFVREHNNVTWKNFDTDDVFAGGYKKYDFWIQGWPRIAYISDLEIDLSELPDGCKVQLQLLKRLTEGAVAEGMMKTEEVERYTTFDLQPHGYAALRNIQLKTSDRSQATLVITLPETIPDGAYQISLQQKVGGKEMGRVTKRLIVGDYPYVVNVNSDEVHIANCAWVQKMLPEHRVAYQDLKLALKHGYNGCYYCLPEYNTG